MAPVGHPASLNERLATDQILEVLVAFVILALLFDGFGHHVSQLGSVEEGARVLEDVIGSIIQELSDEKTNETHQLGMLPEVQLILYTKFQL